MYIALCLPNQMRVLDLAGQLAAYAGEDQLTSDVGWGCTLRSCQMLLAQALCMHAFGRHPHRLSLKDGEEPTLQQHLRSIVRLFHDQPSSEATFSVHAICGAGAKFGLVPGRWMGPYALCRALAVLAGRPGTPEGFNIVTLDSGGGAPCLDIDQCGCDTFACSFGN